eukprot:m.54411 g.54411  ORF g.54411 m.54411 type:complete len:50 (+) comp12458_c0_seq3:1350-1499(+)
MCPKPDPELPDTKTQVANQPDLGDSCGVCGQAAWLIGGRGVSVHLDLHT